MARRTASVPRRACLVALIATTGSLASQRANAQTPPPAEIAVARAQFEIGLEAARAEHWAEARAALARAYAIYPRPLILLNLATAQAHTGFLVEAAESFHRFAREAVDEPALSHRAEAEDAARRIAARVPSVRIVVQDDTHEDRVELDGALVSQALRGVDLPVDPGMHVVTLRRGTATLQRISLGLVEGERRHATLRAPPFVSVLRPRVARTIRVRPPAWPWIVLGTTLGVAAGTAITVAVLASGGPPWVAGNLSSDPLRVH